MPEKPKKQEDDSFSSAGFEGNPSIHGEEQLMHDLSAMPIQVIDAKIQRFIMILNDPDTLPHHRKMFAHLLDYYVFETTYREARGIPY